MTQPTPKLAVVGGPNGAGKSTSAPRLLRDLLGIVRFINADSIAVGLSGFQPAATAFEAGRIMLDQIARFSAKKVDFAFESTLSGRSYANLIRSLLDDGYELHLWYFWLHSADLAVQRVRERVRRGGNDVPEEDIRRRYDRSRDNFFQIYAPVAQTWSVFDNSITGKTVLVASGGAAVKSTIYRNDVWQLFESNKR